jgi:hypothetical protein
LPAHLLIGTSAFSGTVAKAALQNYREIGTLMFWTAALLGLALRGTQPRARQQTGRNQHCGAHDQTNEHGRQTTCHHGGWLAAQDFFSMDHGPNYYGNANQKKSWKAHHHRATFQLYFVGLEQVLPAEPQPPSRKNSSGGVSGSSSTI